MRKGARIRSYGIANRWLGQQGEVPTLKGMSRIWGPEVDRDAAQSERGLQQIWMLMRWRFTRCIMYESQRLGG